jgi:signal transduction histidine kinase
MNPHGKCSRFTRNLLISEVLVVLLAVVFAFYVRWGSKMARAHEQRYLSHLLADELRHSSDDLTRMVRTYVVSGSPVYKQYFQDILDIRNGTKPRPKDYWRVYWDLVLPGGPAPRGSQQTIALLELMQQAGFTWEEFDKLALAKANSDALTALEFDAMKLVESHGPEGENNRARARMLVHDATYHLAKASIMKPIDDCAVLVDQRTLVSVQTAENRTAAFRFLFIACGLGLMFMLWRTYASLRDTLGGAVGEVAAQIARVGSGDSSATIPVKAGQDNSVLGWLSETQTQLNDSARIRRQAEGAMQATNKELEQFIYAVSHDLRSPVVTIQTFLGHLEQDIPAQNAARVADDLHFLHTAADKMGQLLDELLKLSRLGRQVNPPEAVLLQAVAKDVLALVAGRIAQRGAQVTVAKSPATLYGDRARFVSLFQNLLDNACKFMGDQKEPCIEIGVETREAETVFFVRDNGIGIDPRHQSKAFGLFEKLDPNTEGTGMGLALVKRIVELYGGRIWVESKGTGQGTCFYFTLPGANRREI